ncbi:two-component system, OmpR family, phosphate regulon sensor histidine kinase PhoR [Lutibacter oricola]|uniref:histidine kinase n=1 Tax=Lutibacter oricola TaxID=762486 RepID=A0A1H3DDF3_9FLAO|nr:ATP-binding protein [Lutibacter oricola]SDX64387.1 two-component system, OmpR family, phosphate regulon sensor histidine kinase PhoR [Lutibacter oricola]
MKIKKTYSFAFFSSLYITIFTSVTLISLAYFLFDIIPDFWYILLFLIIVFIFTFIVTQFRIEKFIYQRVKKIYDNVSLLDSADFQKTSITSDIATLSREVEKFAKDKQLQIKNLNKREGYRREFLGNISHELKTPLFTVQGYLLTLSDGAINDAKIRDKYIDRANKGVERLIAIVKDLDMISKLEAADLNINKEPFDIVKLVKGIYDLLEIKAKKRNVTLLLDKHYHYPIMVIGDEERYEQVLTNLIVNSIKYGVIGGTTMVSIESFEKNKMLVKVTDNGEGIKAEDQSRLFERFYRVDRSRSRDQGGSGLGLSIVKHIVEAHGEEIFVKSEHKKGSEFSFTIEKSENF